MSTPIFKPSTAYLYCCTNKRLTHVLSALQELLDGKTAQQVYDSNQYPTLSLRSLKYYANTYKKDSQNAK